jgi:hypothetical protein
MATDKSQKVALKFCCNICEYTTTKQYDYIKHNTTQKHIRNILATSSNQLSLKINVLNNFTCNTCNKNYKDRTGLWRHKKTCNNNIVNFELTESKPVVDYNITSETIVNILKQNNELQQMLLEQNKTIIELSKNNQITNTNISHNNSHNNSHNKAFNLNFFLNETCKNAMNITEFADSIKLQLSDFENVGDVGFITGISNIIIKKLKALDVTQRPVHCTDQKREIIYIKDEDKWEKEDDKKQKFHKFLKKIINKNQRLILKFQEVYPDYNKYSSPNSTRYDKIVIEALGGRGDNNLEKEDKILSIISKTIGVDKEK